MINSTAGAGALYPQPSWLPVFNFGPLLVTQSYSGMLILSPVVVLAIALFLKRSKFGLAIRAAAANPEAARMSGLPMARLRVYAVAGAALLTGAAVAAAGVIGFVGLAAPHLVRALVKDDPKRILWPSALAGALLLVLADLAARLVPTEQGLPAEAVSPA